MPAGTRYKMDGSEIEQNPSSFVAADGHQPRVEYVPLIGTDTMRIAHEPGGSSEIYAPPKRKWNAEWKRCTIALISRFLLKRDAQLSFTFEIQDYAAASDTRAPTVNPSGDDVTYYGPQRPVVNDATYKVYDNGVLQEAGFTVDYTLNKVTFASAATEPVTLEYTWKPTMKVDSFTFRRVPYSVGLFDAEGVLSEV